MRQIAKKQGVRSGRIEHNKALREAEEQRRIEKIKRERECYQKIKALVQDGMSVRAACFSLGLNRNGYMRIQHRYPELGRMSQHGRWRFKRLRDKGELTPEMRAKMTSHRPDSKSGRIVAMANGKNTVSQIAQAIGVTPEYVYTTRTKYQLDIPSDGRKQWGRISKTQTPPPNTLASRVRRLLVQNMSYQEIARTLETTEAYVRAVKNRDHNIERDKIILSALRANEPLPEIVRKANSTPAHVKEIAARFEVEIIVPERSPAPPSRNTEAREARDADDAETFDAMRPLVKAGMSVSAAARLFHVEPLQLQRLRLRYPELGQLSQSKRGRHSREK